MFDHDDAPRKKRGHEIGQDLADLAISDIDERIALLRGEIVRLEEARARKVASQAVADALFKRPG